VKSFLNQRLGQYITNVTRAAEVCSDFLCQSNGRCVRRDLHAPYYLHLSGDSYHIQPSGDGDFAVTGKHSLRELQLLAKRFHCHCYEGHAGEKCDSLNKVVAEEEEEEGGEADDGEKEQRESAAPQTGNSFSLVVLLLLLNVSFV
jgi:hyaluronoglucosaminidase